MATWLHLTHEIEQMTTLEKLHLILVLGGTLAGLLAIAALPKPLVAVLGLAWAAATLLVTYASYRRGP